MKPVLLIHEFKEVFLNLNLDNYILSFDDGLISQYTFLPEILKIKTPKFFNISTGVVCPSNVNPSFKFISCYDARKKALNGNFENYMTWEMIKFIHNKSNCTIAGHSHSHTNLNIFKTLYDKIEYIKEDSKQMFEKFEKHLNYKPKVFCFPFNDDFKGFYKNILNNNYNINKFLGKERIEIEDLL